LRSPQLAFPRFASILVLSIAAACSERIPAELTSAADAPRLEARPANTSCLAGALPLGRVRLQPTFKGFVNPLRMVDRPDRGLVYIAEMAGRVRAVERATGKVTTALDMIGVR
jgi:hypothetical protein